MKYSTVPVRDIHHSGQELRTSHNRTVNMNDLAKNEEFLKSAFKGDQGIEQNELETFICRLRSQQWRQSHSEGVQEDHGENR